MKQNRHYLNAMCHCCSRKARAASVQSSTLWQQATIEITSSLLLSLLASTMNCSLASQSLLEVTHQDHSIGITLILLVRAQGRTQGGVGFYPPLWAWYFTKTLLPAQRRLTIFAYFLLVNLSTYCKYHRINLHANFKEHCKWA